MHTTYHNAATHEDANNAKRLFALLFAEPAGKRERTNYVYEVAETAWSKRNE